MTETYKTFEERQLDRAIEAAETRAGIARDHAKEAIAELEKVKKDIGWMMKHGLIRDIIFRSDEMPAGEPPYTMDLDPEDTVRLRWLNEHGRVTLGNGNFTVSFPHGGDIGNEILPTPYNIRHLLDLCRRSEGSIEAPVRRVTPDLESCSVVSRVTPDLESCSVVSRVTPDLESCSVVSRVTAGAESETVSRNPSTPVQAAAGLTSRNAGTLREDLFA